ncbi:MAG: diaminopimelate epimerase [Phycisphaerae bacterium]|nr:diaminopimelate epimerase [Phycisphaerae bacterium]
MQFTKMHGIGNDYVYVNCFEEHIEQPEKLAIAVSDRHRGIGGDGLILIYPSKKADARMRIFNADGSEAEMCGNGLRCVAKYVYEHGLAKSKGRFTGGENVFADSLKIETGNGVLTVGLDTRNGKVPNVCVNMGQPILNGLRIPTTINAEQIINYPIEINGQKLLMTAVSMGNPHAVFFCEKVETIELEKIGPMIENHQFFPKRTNVHFVTNISSREFRMRTWERGSGITLACGTGACACCIANILTNNVNRTALAHLPGGDLHLHWSEKDGCVYMTGPAEEVFEGVWPDKNRP